MDDALAFVGSRERARDVRAGLAAFVAEGLDQELKHEVTVLAPCRVGVPFLGFRIWPQLVRLDAARKRRLARTLRHLDTLPEAETARRVQGVIGWVGQANTVRLRRAWLGVSRRS